MGGMGIGVLLAVSSPARVGLSATYLHLLVVGWLTQLIFGIAHWLFPRASAATPRGDERIGWAGLLLLNLGLLLRAGIEPMVFGQPRHTFLLTSAALQFLALLLLVLHIWPRVKER